MKRGDPHRYQYYILVWTMTLDKNLKNPSSNSYSKGRIMAIRGQREGRMGSNYSTGIVLRDEKGPENG